MPAWIHDRAERIRGKNPEMPEGMSYALATQQAHKIGKSPKTFKSKETGKKERFGTPLGRAIAKAKFDKPKKEYKKTASEGSMETGLETNEAQSASGDMPHQGGEHTEHATNMGDTAPTNVSGALGALFDNKTESHQGRETTLSSMSSTPPSIKTAMYTGFFEEFAKIAGGSPQLRIVGKELKRRAEHLKETTGHKAVGEATESVKAVVDAARRKLPWHSRATQFLKREEHPAVVRAVRKHTGVK